jgi:membrane protease YdiL (CAAX protease family)
MGTPLYTRNDAVSILDWLIYLMPLIVLVFLQIGAEELFFRGYLLRLIYSRKARLFWAVYIPSFLFGLAHLDPITYGVNSVLYVLNTTVTGVILCFITLWRGNIAMAMGIHFAVNIFAILIIGQGDTPIGSGAALLLSTIAPKSATLGLSMILITVVEIVLYSIWARRRYGALIPSEAR